MLEHRSPRCSSTLKNNRVIFSEVSRNRIVSNYDLLAEHARRRRSWTRVRVNRGFEHPGSLRMVEKGYLSTLKHLGGWSTLEQGSTSILEHLGNSSILAARVCSSGAITVVPLLEHAEHRSMLCSNMLVPNTKQSQPDFRVLSALRILFRGFTPEVKKTIVVGDQ